MDVGFDAQLLHRFPPLGVPRAPNRQHPRQVLIGLCKTDTGFEPCDAEVIGVLRAGSAAGYGLCQEQVGVNVEEFKPARHYTNHLITDEIDEDQLTQYALATAESALPVFVGKNDSFLRARHLIRA